MTLFVPFHFITLLSYVTYTCWQISYSIGKVFFFLSNIFLVQNPKLHLMKWISICKSKKTSSNKEIPNGISQRACVKFHLFFCILFLRSSGMAKKHPKRISFTIGTWLKYKQENRHFMSAECWMSFLAQIIFAYIIQRLSKCVFILYDSDPSMGIHIHVVQFIASQSIHIFHSFSILKLWKYFSLG